MKNSNLLKNRRINRHTATVVGLMLFVCVMMLILKPGVYFTSKNLKSMLFQFPEYGILAFGMMLCMISGGIDLSLVGIMNLSGVLAALILTSLVPSVDGVVSNPQMVVPAILLAVFTAIAVGAICGLFNGLIIGGLHLPAMLVTLCTLQLFTGIVYGITGGPAINGMCDAFKEIANGTILDTGIPWVLPIFLAVLAGVAFILKHTVLGHEIYFLGSNPKAAMFSGINTLRVSLLTYMTSGILGGISGILITSHLNAAKSSNGASYTLLSILIVVLGGVHPDGGKGSVLGVTLAILLMQMISNAFTILHVSQDANNFANGALLIAALVITAAIKLITVKKSKSQSSAE